MRDYISRADLMNHIENEAREWGEDYDAEQFLGDVEDFPAADVRPVVHGEWFPAKDGYYGHVMCSNCHKIESRETDFCPNCGADCRGGNDGK